MTEVTILTLLAGKTLAAVERTTYERYGEPNDAIKFTLPNGNSIMMTHCQDCCESVYLEDVNGDLQHLVGEPILLAEERVVCGGDTDIGSTTATFYEIVTRKGRVSLTWRGESNGYYSESVDLVPGDPEGRYSDLNPETWECTE